MAKQARRKQSTPGWLLGVVVAAAVVLAGLMIWAGSRPAGDPGNTATVPDGANIGLSMGRADAPILIEVFSDFQCSHCQTAATELIPRLVPDYVNTGKVRVTFRNFPRIGPESLAAAKAAVCAGDQGQFWAYHDKLFAVQRTPGAYLAGNLLAYARELGLDTAAWSQCIKTDDVDKRVAADLSDGRERGLRGTPTFYITAGGRTQTVEGAVPYDQFLQVVNAAVGQ